MSRRILSLLLFTIALGASFVGCPCSRATINASESMRWWLFSNFGAQKICPETLKRGVAIKLSPLGGGSVGRFFPSQCQVQIDDASHTMVLNIFGSGYLSLPVTKRVGFTAGLSVEYRPDFRLEEDAMYVWGRFNRLMAPPNLQIQGVENPVVNLATMTPIGNLATVLGQGIVTNELGKGFTVVRRDDGDDFAMGILMPPAKPPRLFEAGEDHVVLASDYSELSPLSRDYLGPFEVPKNGQALFAKFRVQGAPIVTAVVDKRTGDLWRQSYELAQPLGAPPGPVLASTTIQPGGQGNQTIPLARGTYYLVVENQTGGIAALGIPIPFSNASSSVSYSVEVGDR